MSCQVPRILDYFIWISLPPLGEVPEEIISCIAVEDWKLAVAGDPVRSEVVIDWQFSC